MAHRREEEEHSLVVGTQDALAGVGDAVSAAHGVVDHAAGHQLPAILQRGAAELAAVQLGKQGQQRLCHGLRSMQGSPNTSPLLRPMPKPA